MLISDLGKHFHESAQQTSYFAKTFFVYLTAAAVKGKGQQFQAISKDAMPEQDAEPFFRLIHQQEGQEQHLNNKYSVVQSQRSM